MEKFYFTFGCGGPLKSNYFIIVAKNWHDAHAEMFRHFGEKWAFQYTEEEFRGQPEQYSLTQIGDIAHAA